MRALQLSLLVALSGAILIAQAERPTELRPAVDVAAALQERYDSVGDFSASFVHTYEGGLLRTTASERGDVQIKKPGKMRWSYREPEEKLFVSDGRTMYSYVPADRQVIVTEVASDGQGGAPVLFLAGTGDLTRDFDVSYASGLREDGPGTLALELTPRVAEPDYESIVLVVDEASLQIRRLVTVDPQGGTSTLIFDGIRENLGIADSSFAFTVPRGVDVISNNQPSR